jgi:hypothetical protein
VLARELIQPPIEGVAHGRRQIGHCDPHLRLSIPSPFAHGHGRECSTRCRFPFLIHRDSRTMTLEFARERC